MSKNYDLYKELLRDYEEVCTKLLHYQANAYQWFNKVAYYEKAWSEIDPELFAELSSTVVESDTEIAKKRVKKFVQPGGQDGVQE